MRKVLLSLLSFILMVILSISCMFIIYEINVSKKSVLKQMDNIQYYQKAYKNIITKVSDYVINEELENEYKKIITIDRVKVDILKSINNVYDDTKYNVSIKEELNEVIKKYDIKDSNIIKTHTDGINEIYVNNLFLTKEFKLIKKYTLDFETLMLITYVAIFFLLAITLILDKQYLKISLISTSITLVMPMIYLNLFNIIKNFQYSNSYYTELILTIIESIYFELGLISIVIIIFIILYKLLNLKKCKI